MHANIVERGVGKGCLSTNKTGVGAAYLLVSGVRSRHDGAMKMKKKTMTSVRRNVERELGRGLYDAWWLVESVLSCTASLVWYLSLTSQVLLIMFGVAVVIEFVREALEVMGGVLSPLTGVLDVMFTAIGIIFDAVIEAIRVVTFGFVHIRPLDPVKMYKSIGAFLETITHVKVDCAGYTTWPHVLGFFIGQGTRDTICPILRFVYPAPELRVPMMAMLGWLSLDPDPNGNNCQDTASDWLCACLGIGYLVIDFLLPLFLVRAPLRDAWFGARRDPVR